MKKLLLPLLLGFTCCHSPHSHPIASIQPAITLNAPDPNSVFGFDPGIAKQDPHASLEWTNGQMQIDLYFAGDDVGAGDSILQQFKGDFTEFGLAPFFSLSLSRSLLNGRAHEKIIRVDDSSFGIGPAVVRVKYR